MDYCRNLKFEEEPGYDYLINLLLEMLGKNNLEAYDWKVFEISKFSDEIVN